MNRLFGFFSFQQRIPANILEKSQFQHAAWIPDHRGHYTNDNLLLTSTQRFITPQCPLAPMPFVHEASKCVIIADVYLTHRAALCEHLHCALDTADATLVLLGYLKWGAQVTRYLCGDFCFAIWNPKEQALFLATDHFSKRPLLYAYQPGQPFVFANEFSSFRQVLPTVTINDTMFAHVALDALPGVETCYKEVFKLRPGHQLYVTPHGIKETCYWRLQDQRRRLPYRTREAYYEAFQSLFETAVSDRLRTQFPILSHISGGLDSTSVTAQAAALLSEQQRSLVALTAIPNDLSGPSFRKGWQYHEMPVVQTVLDKYPNILHVSYRASPATDLFNSLKAYFPVVDQPFRNISNYDWILGTYAQAQHLGARVILTGGRGNGSISWSGSSSMAWLKNIVWMCLTYLQPHKAFHSFFENCGADFLKSAQAKKILRRRTVNFSPQEVMLSAALSWARQSSSYAVSLCNGVLLLDPTQDVRIVEFCYNVPNWVYCKGPSVTDKRLLVREGLAHLLTPEVTGNPYRGEQAADWFLQYNQHATRWYEQLDSVSDQTKSMMSRYYNLQQYADLQQSIVLPITENHIQTNRNCNLLMLRYLSAAFFLDYLTP